jgi:adenylate cyclase
MPSLDQKMGIKLVITNNETGRSVDYFPTRDDTRIGRAVDQNDIVLEDAQVSRHHALIRRAGASFTLVDPGSANGTFINGHRINEHMLRDRDLILIGKYTLEFTNQAPAAISIKYDEKQIGNTVLLRAPSELGTIIPKMDSVVASSAEPGSKSLLEYVEVLRKKAETLARIYELNQMLGSHFSQADIFKKVSEMVFRLTPADRFLVLLKEGGAGELATVAAEFRDPDGTQAQGQITISKTVVDRVMSERMSLLSFDTQSDERFLAVKSIVMQNITSVMCAPLLGKDGVLGVIYVDCRERLKLLREDDLDLLNAVAAETSIAVDNALTHKRLVKEELARAKYRRFMPAHVVDEILANPDEVMLGGANCCVTVLFSDIRGFTSMSEQLNPEIVVQILNEYFADMTPIVFNNRGLLDKFMGDGMMALFGVPYPTDDAAADAVSAAIAMQRGMAALNEDLKTLGLSEIAIGIGINTGTVTVGYIGSRERTDYTAIGDAVNLAARLEKRAESGQIIISRSTLDAIGARFPVRTCDRIMVKGKQESIEIYEVLWQEASESSVA